MGSGGKIVCENVQDPLGIPNRKAKMLRENSAIWTGRWKPRAGDCQGDSSPYCHMLLTL